MYENFSLFRGKDKSNKWVEGNLVANKYIINAKEQKQISSKGTVDFPLTAVNTDTISVFTGITDINNVKVFTGDVVTHYSWVKDEVIMATVEFEDSMFMCRIDEYNYSILADWKNHGDTLEVIGNIFDTSKKKTSKKT